MKGKFQETKDIMEKSKELESMLSAAEEEVDRLTNALEILREQLQEKYESQIEVLQSQSKQWERKSLDLEKQLASAQSNNQSKLNALKKQIQALTDTTTDLAAKISMMERDLATKEQTIETLQHDLSTTKVSLKEMTSEKAKLISKCNSLEDLVAKLKTDLLLAKSDGEEALRKAKEDADALSKATIDDLNAQLKLLNVQLKSSRKLEEEHKAKIQELLKQIEDMQKAHEQEINEMLEEAENSMKEQGQAEEATEKRINTIREEYEEEIVTLKEHLRSAEQAQQDLKMKCADAESTIKSLEEENASLKNQSREKSDSGTKKSTNQSNHDPNANGIISSLEEKLSCANATIDDLTETVQNLEDTVQHLKAKRSNNGTKLEKTFTDSAMQTEEVSDDEIDDIFGDDVFGDDDLFSDDEDEEEIKDEMANEGDQPKEVKDSPIDLKASGDFSEKSKQLATIMAFIRDNNIRLLDFFTSLDENNDGVLSQNEFVSGICRVIEGAHENELIFSKDILEEIFETSDVEKQGVLTYKQFLKSFKKQFKRREVRYFAKKLNMIAKKKKKASRKDSTSLVERHNITDVRPASSGDSRSVKFLQAKVDELESKSKEYAQIDHLNAELSKKYQETLEAVEKYKENNESIEKAKQKLEENVKALEEEVSKGKQDIEDLLLKMDTDKDEMEEAALSASNLSLDAQLVKMVHRVLRRVEKLNALGFKVSKGGVFRENPSGQFRRQLNDLNSSCKLVFNCLRTRYPALSIFKDKKRSNGYSNLPQLVISGESKGATGPERSEMLDYFALDNSVYQHDANSLDNFLGGRRQFRSNHPAWDRGQLDTLNSSAVLNDLERVSSRAISRSSSEVMDHERSAQAFSVKSKNKYVMTSLRRSNTNFPSSLKSKTSKKHSRKHRSRPSTVDTLSLSVGPGQRAWTSQSSTESTGRTWVESTPNLFVGFQSSPESSSILLS